MEEIQSKVTNQSSANKEAFAIVGIAASHTKLDALEKFLDNMDASSGVAFLIMQYDSTKNIGFSSQLLAEHTSMNIYNAKDRMVISANSIYLLPPDMDLDIVDGTLRIMEYNTRLKLVNPVDRFLGILVDKFGSNTICILLSGGGIDGTRGIDKVIKANGLVMIEEKKLSKVVRVQGSDLEIDRSDYVLKPEEMGQYIIEYIDFFKKHTREAIEGEKKILFSILKEATNVDFTLYKQASILRRIQRRMGIKGFHYLKEYNHFLYNDLNEVFALQKDLLIGVTQFFRDPDAFKVVSDQVLPQIFEQRALEKQIRVWVAGCSTGEEVYSLAILIRQYMNEIEETFDVKIFATDLDKESIQIASRGQYSDNITKSISPEHLKMYFTLQGDKYQITKEIRQMVIFTTHNILKDPPFIQLDLITCRNLLIYLVPEMQRKVISLFHFALKSEAYLFLGPSESLGKLSVLFKTFDSKWNIYQYKETNHWLTANTFGLSEVVNDKKLSHRNKVIARLKETERIMKLDNIYTKLIEDYVAACIIVDENNEIIHINGNSSKYLIIPRGKPSHSLFKMVPDYLSVAIGTALYKARKENKEVIYRDVHIKNFEGKHSINLITKPFQVNSNLDKLMIIFFEEVEKKPLINYETEVDPDQLYFNIESNVSQHIKDLENELYQAKESLQATIEELETSNEEFQAANEELIVANEELQSMNEELQLVNEELIALNNVYQYKIQELTDVNSDLSNFFISTDVATIFLDTALNIRKFTPMITKEMNLLDTDIGRPISNILHNFKNENFIVYANEVMQSGAPMEKEIKSMKGRWFNLRITPYLAMDNLIQGIVLTFNDITELKKVNNELIILSYAIEQSPGSIIITDINRRIKYINAKYSEQTGYTMDELADTQLELYSHNLSIEQIKDIWAKVALGKRWVGELLNRKKTGEISFEHVSLLPIKDAQGEIIHFLKISEDISEQKHTLELLHKSEMLSAVGQLAAGIAHEIRNPLTALKGFTKLLEPTTVKKNYIQIMSSELDRIETIISELLMLARPQKMHFEKKDVLIILQDVIMLLESQANLNNVEIITKFASSIPLINCVQNQLKQVFINIIKNGIEAMPRGGHLIVIVKKLVSNELLISFIDHGVGIPENKIPKIGDPFYTTKDNGTGLGLMVSFKIIENHQGTIALNSTLGKGTTVDIKLNLEKIKE